MAVYDQKPYLLGNRWVPIRDEQLEFTRFDNPVEYGHSFTLNRTVNLNAGFFYIADYPDDFTLYLPVTMSVYPRYTEAETGPIQRLVVPIGANTTITNTAGSGAILVNANTIPEALQDPGSDSFVQLQSGSNLSWLMKASWNIQPFANYLAGKRIVAVNLLYGGQYTPQALPNLQPNLRAYLNGYTAGSTSGAIFYPLFKAGSYVPNTVNRISLGDANAWFKGNTTAIDDQDIAPWTPTELQRFGSTTGLALYLEPIIVAESLFIDEFVIAYMALEILYCEETRAAFGTKFIGPIFSNHTGVTPGNPGHNAHPLWYQMNANRVLFVDPTSNNPNPTLTPGDYTVTVQQSNVGPAVINGGPFKLGTAPLKAARQLFRIPQIGGIKINHPSPQDANIAEKTFTKEDYDILPQLSLFSSGGTTISVMPEVHAYGGRAIARVYGSHNAVQRIMTDWDSTLGVQQYRSFAYYARRFGNTSVPLLLQVLGASPASGFDMEITPYEFDLLPEIVDGWKQVQLAPPGGGAFNFNPNDFVRLTWSATNEQAGSRWEVLGASSYAISGLPDRQFQETILQWQPYGATYGEPVSGAPVNWTFYGSPNYGSGNLDVTDLSADACVTLVNRNTTVATFTVTQLVQPVSGAVIGCDLDPCGIPTGIYYNQLDWSYLSGSHIYGDQFLQTNSNGWGANYTTSGNATAFSTGNGIATINDPVIATDYARMDNLGVTDVISACTVSPKSVFGGIGTVRYGHHFTTTGTFPYWFVNIVFNFNTQQITMEPMVANSATPTSLGTAQVAPVRPVINARYRVKMQMNGGLIQGKIWPIAQDEPEDWLVTALDPAYTVTSANRAFIGTTGASNFTFENLWAADPYHANTKIQIARSDALDGTLRIIVKQDELSITRFNDYEARVGIPTNYQINLVDDQGVVGFSVGTGLVNTIPAPGVTGDPNCIKASGTHVLIFTSNEGLGTKNLAYTTAWQGGVEESFSFPESGFVQLQAMYGKDFYTAFHGTERGGDRFQRAVLVQAAAIPPETLAAGFKGLRDMAWQDVSYICVRDEDGNRWFASVLVPQGSVTNSRKLYIANVDIIEVAGSDNPSHVNTPVT